ncbi:MAG: hypothetical protein H6631_12180 [Anaerolineaceae bacterium]|nr:hypothetical protein [Anaerolineaceae bacterium]MCB9098567.1 hypothetical protein [Anaerolineales bacterium]
MKSLKPTLLRLISTLGILAALWILFLTVAAAQSFDAKVSFFYVPPPDDQAFHVGDRITLRLEVRHPADSYVEMPTLPEGESWGDFEVVSQSEPEVSRRGDNVAITRKDIVVTLFEPGQYQTPRLLVTHLLTDGTSEELAAPVIQLNIDSILVEDDTELRDIKEQAILPVPPIWPWVLLSILVALPIAGLIAAGGFWLYHRLKQRHQLIDMPVPAPIDTRPPEVIAYAELDRIEALNLPAKELYKDHYTLVTDCLRRYIEGRYQIPALERTTDELRLTFMHSASIKDQRRKFIEIFTQSDLVKFARFRPQLEDAYELIQQARKIIQSTTPILEPPDDQIPKETVEEVTA